MTALSTAWHVETRPSFQGRVNAKVQQHLVNVSGGKDETAVHLRAIQSGRPSRAVFAETGDEHPAVYDFIAELPQRAGGAA